MRKARSAARGRGRSIDFHLDDFTWAPTFEVLRRRFLDPIGPRIDNPKTQRLKRLVSRNVGGMLARNTVVGTSVFVLDLLLLWILVEEFGIPKLIAATIGFVVASSVHYLAGRSWIFEGTTRHIVSGYFYFLLSACVGLAITIAMFAAFIHWTTINYLVARVIVSLFAGLATFLLNAVYTFRRI